MDPFWDENNEEERLKRKLENFYGEFSAEARKKLLSKNIKRPSDIYEVFYVKARENLVARNAKNTIFSDNLNDSSKAIRDALVAKNTPNNSDLLQKSEDIKKSLESRNKIIDNRDDLINTTEQIRKNLLSKNVDNKSDLDSQSEAFRNNQKARNKSDVSSGGSIDTGDSLEKSSEPFRNNLKTKGSNPREGELDQDSEVFRDNQKARNSNVDTSIDQDSEAFRKNLISKNKKNKSLFANDDLENNSETFRSDLLAKNGNTNLEVSLEDVFESTRNALLAKNVDRSVSLLEVSEAFRKALVSKNFADDTTLDELFEGIRKNLIAKNNIHKIGEDDLVGKSAQFKKDLLAKNVVDDTSLEIMFEGVRNDLLARNRVNRDGASFIDMFDQIRQNLLAKNKSESRETLDILFEQEKKNLLAKNVSNGSNLESDSSSFRGDLVSKNSNVTTNLEFDSEPFRENSKSRNSNVITNLEVDSESFRESSKSRNSNVITNLEVDSESFRDNLEDKNIPNPSNLESDSTPFRDDLEKRNTPNSSDLEVDSTPFRGDLVSRNTPNPSDLEVESTPFRDGLTSLNTPKNSDLEVDSTPFRGDLTSRNTPRSTNLETDSTPFRDDLISKNVPEDSDLETDSVLFRSNLESRNVPSSTDLEADSVPFRDGLESKNVPSSSDLEGDSTPIRGSLEAKNVPNGSNLLLDSTGFRTSVVAKNVSKTTNLIIDSQPAKDSLEAKNVSSDSDLLRDSRLTKENLLTRNTGGLIGVNINAAGTSTFLGVSRVLTQGILFRKLLTARNDVTEKAPYTNELGEFITDDTRIPLIEKKPSTFSLERLEFVNSVASDTSQFTSDLGALALFGTGTRNPGQTYDRDRDGIALDNVSQSTQRGGVTDAMKRYNISRNIYAPNQSELRDLSAVSSLEEDYVNVGLPTFINKNVGSLAKPGEESGGQYDTPTTPFDIILQNNGGYTKAAPEDLLNPIDGDVNTAEGIVAKQSVGNVFMDDDFRTGRRGVKKVINVIKNSDLNFASNFDPQNSREFATGLKPDGSVRKGFQRYTVANPYAPEGAEKMRFLIINYSMDRSTGGMVFPPYITAFQHGSSVNWNSVEFLGRPEPLYTYNNTRRSGSVSFFVLTDYAQLVDIGVDFENGTTITEEFNRSFTDYNKVENAAKVEEIRGLIKQREKDLKELVQNQKDNATVTASETATSNVRKQELLDEIRNLTTEVWELNRLATAPNYSEANALGQNVYRDVVGRRTREEGTGEFSSTPEDTQTRLNQMKQNLMFQPSYFSGDKVDFIRKIEFLEKTTRPSRNNGPGFSFINPPICHMHLGDYFNHDIVINSIDYDYTDAPWTFDGGRVQPMYVQVTMSFDIIGRYRHTTGPPILSTDVGGFFSDANTFKAKR